MKYKGTFNYHGQNITLWTYAKNERVAFNHFINRLSKEIRVIRINLYNYFKSRDKDNYIIEEKERK